jgi:uncharacterized radical SAM superfamily Fe-S cluster-containing enzyme
MSAQPASFARSLSNAAWVLAENINSILPQGKLRQPSWATSPLPRSWERVPMAIGVPRRTLSLCPECNREAVDSVTRGESSVADFRNEPGIIEAEIVEEAGRILMRKACEKHGPFEDVLSNHPAFFKRMESLGFGRDFNCAGGEKVHNHGANGIKTGRGTYLIVDLTNRCNMFCSPCYMDANAASYVHELDMQDVTVLFERTTSFKPQREINVLFSGGEATLSPIFLDAVRHAKSKGFHRLHVATNGIRFAQEKDFAVNATAAGLHAVYLQFDGVTEEKNGHRGIGNYMEVKRRALDNIAAAGMKTTLQVTVENRLNNDGVGDIIRFVADHIEKIHGIIFQPVMVLRPDDGDAHNVFVDGMLMSPGSEGYKVAPPPRLLDEFRRFMDSRVQASDGA